MFWTRFDDLDGVVGDDQLRRKRCGFDPRGGTNVSSTLFYVMHYIIIF